MSRTLGFGLLGAGHVASFHARAIQASRGGRLLAVADVDATRAGTLAAEFNARPCASLEDLLQTPDLHAICVLTPSHLHHEAVLKCARAKRHVIIEQPPALSLAEADEMLAACSKKKVRLASTVRGRSGEPIRLLKEAISSGRFGKLLQVDVCVKSFCATEYYFSEPWLSSRRSGAGVTLQHAFHYIDLLLHLAGHPTRVEARMTNLNHPSVEVEDTLLACLRFENGAQGILEASTALWPGTDARVEINGTNGTAILCGTRMTAWKFRDERPEDATILGRDYAIPGAEMADVSAVVQDLIDSVHAKREVIVPVSSVRPALETALAMYQSAARGAPVGFPVTDDPSVLEAPLQV